MRRRKAQSILSTVLLVASLVLLATVAVLYVRDRNDGGDPKPPTAVPGHNEAIDVLNAIEAEGLDAEFGGPGTDVRSRMLEGAGQTIELDAGTVYAFIYTDESQQDDVTLDVLAEDVDIVDVSGNALDVTDAHLFTNSNVAVLLVSSDEETIEGVEAAVAALT
jgi:hypothetical protein